MILGVIFLLDGLWAYRPQIPTPSIYHSERDSPIPVPFGDYWVDPGGTPTIHVDPSDGGPIAIPVMTSDSPRHSESMFHS